MMRALAGAPADRYFESVLAPGLSRANRGAIASREAARDLLLDPFGCLAAILGHYAFMRRGRDRAQLSDVACSALFDTFPPDEFETLLRQGDGVQLWEAFREACEEQGRKPMEGMNYGVVAGLAELAQEVFRLDGLGSIAQWLADAVIRTGRVETEFMRIVDIRGVGPKFASIFLRDTIDLLELERHVEHIDRLYLQPIDKWIRLAAHEILDAQECESAADWVLAGKLAKYARHCGVSGTRFNMGATFVGTRDARSPEDYSRRLRKLATMI